MIAVKLTQVGNSLGIVLPKEAIAKLGAQKGDTLYLTDAAQSTLTLSAYDHEVAEQIRAGEEFMSRYRNTLRALAK